MAIENVLPTAEQKNADAKRLFADAKAKLGSVTAETLEATLAETDEMMKQAKLLQKQALQLKDLEEVQDAYMPHDAAPVEDKSARPEKKFKDWPDFLRSTWLAMHRDPSVRREDKRLVKFIEKEGESGMDAETKVMTEGVGAAGGFLVPVQFMPELQGVMSENAIIWNLCTRIRMNTRQVAIPVLDQTGTTAGYPHWFGGIRFYYIEEATEKTESTPSFREVNLVAHKLIGLTNASDELVADSAISLADFLSGPLGFAGGISWWRDYCVFQGTGVGQPLGIINAGATITVARQAQAPANAIQYLDIVNMFENFLPSAKGHWYFTQQAVSNLLTLADANGNYIWLPNLFSAAGNVNQQLLGLPVTFTEKLPALLQAGDAVLADPRYYLFGDRQAMTIDTTIFHLWAYDKTSWRVVDRHDGQPWLSSPLTYQDGTVQVSPFIILGNKSS